MKTRKKLGITIIAGMLLMALGFFYQVTGLTGENIGLIFINAGVILMVVAVLKYNKLGAGVRQDEMSRMISSRGLAHSWFLTFVVINLLFWFDSFEILNLTVQQLLGVIIFFMIISASVFKFILAKNPS
jgi:uncharacterized membrane protein YidH (DUF202 family)